MIRKNFALLLALLVMLPQRPHAQDSGQARPEWAQHKIGLVLGGGGAKGIAHIVVLELIEELGIPIDLVIGVSSGAIIGGLYSAGYSAAMMRDSLLDLEWTSFFQDNPVSPFDDELNSGDLLLRYGIENGGLAKGYSPGESAYLLFKKLTAKIPSYIDFDTLHIPFRAGVVEIPEGNVDLVGSGDLAEAIRASIGLPGVFDPFDIDGKLLIDGGTLDNLPIKQAREMGCDIVIAAELFPGPKSISTSPFEVPELMLSLYFNTISSEQYRQADVILMPEVHNYSILDFQKAREIYSATLGEKERMREELEKVRELLIRSELLFGDSDPGRSRDSVANELFSRWELRKSGSYRDLPHLVPEHIIISGAVDRDRHYMEKHFNRLIRGKSLEGGNLDEFVQMVYKTGHYRFAAVRIAAGPDTADLELVLYPDINRRIVLLLGGNYQGTLYRNNISKISLQGGVQIQGITGPGSALSLHSSIMDVFSLETIFLQPLSPGAFLKAGAVIQNDRDIVVSGFDHYDAKENRLLFFSGSMGAGALMGPHSVLKGGPFFCSVAPKNTSTVKEAWNKAMGVEASFSSSKLDYLFLPSKGIYTVLENRFYVPLPFTDPWFFDIVSAELQGAIALGNGFSLVASAFAGANLGPKPPEEFAFTGFSGGDRFYFPHIAGKEIYRANKAAAALTLQFQPWKNLVILGGQLIFSLSVSAGELLDEWPDFSIKNITWKTSLNAGLRLKNNFGLLFRAGAGSNGYERPSPFIAFDIGQELRHREFF